MRSFFLFVCVALLAAATALPASADVRGAAVQWIAVGPDGSNIQSGKVNAFAVDDKNPKIMYFGGGWGNTPRESPSQSGVWGTTDGGSTWHALDNGLTNPDGTVSGVINGLWMDQNNPQNLLVATEFGGTFHSTDGGTSWTNLDRNESTQFDQVDKTIYVATRAGVLVSTDDGNSFTTSLADKYGVDTVNTAAGVTYAGDANGDVYRETSFGHWQVVGHPGSGPVHNVIVDPFNPKIVYANVDDVSAWNQDMYGSINGGKTWVGVNCNCSIGAQAIAFSKVVKDRVYFGDDGGGAIFYFTADGSANPSISAGANPYGVDMRTIYVEKGTSKTDDACYLGMDQGLFYTPTCTSGSAPQLNANVPDTLAYDVKVAPDDKTAIVPLQDNSAAASTDGGKTWYYPNGASFAGEGGEAFIDPYNTNLCFFLHPDGGLFPSSSGCGNFTGPVTSGAESLTFEPSKTGKMYAITNADASAQIDVSGDGGNSWNAVTWKSFVNPYQVAVSPDDAKTILVADGTDGQVNHLSYSHDGGKTWKRSTGLPISRFAQGTIYFATHRFFAAFEPRSNGTILLCDHEPNTDDVRIYRSTDNGAAFSLVKTFKQPVPPRPWPFLLYPNPFERARHPHAEYYATRFYGNRLAFNFEAATGKTPAVVLTTRFGAFASFDAGTSWTRIDMTTISHHFEGLGWNDGYVYLATYGQGVIRTTRPLQ